MSDAEHSSRPRNKKPVCVIGRDRSLHVGSRAEWGRALLLRGQGRALLGWKQDQAMATAQTLGSGYGYSPNPQIRLWLQPKGSSTHSV